MPSTHAQVPDDPAIYEHEMGDMVAADVNPSDNFGVVIGVGRVTEVYWPDGKKELLSWDELIPVDQAKFSLWCVAVKRSSMNAIARSELEAEDFERNARRANAAWKRLERDIDQAENRLEAAFAVAENAIGNDEGAAFMSFADGLRSFSRLQKRVRAARELSLEK